MVVTEAPGKSSYVNHTLIATLIVKKVLLEYSLIEQWWMRIEIAWDHQDKTAFMNVPLRLTVISMQFMVFYFQPEGAEGEQPQ